MESECPAIGDAEHLVFMKVERCCGVGWEFFYVDGEVNGSECYEQATISDCSARGGREMPATGALIFLRELICWLVLYGGEFGEAYGGLHGEV
jgi:hypothetical protein